MESEEEFCRTAEVAKAAGVTVNTLRGWRVRGLLPGGLQARAGEHSRYGREHVLRACILGMLSRLGYSDRLKLRIAKLAERSGAAEGIALFPVGMFQGHAICAVKSGQDALEEMQKRRAAAMVLIPVSLARRRASALFMERHPVRAETGAKRERDTE